ncbi:AraC family transcriptional regulator [Luteibacter anthropi]|uniref:AraC family transcriptional regulator n=1 Tax=Luteibacter anthropi TaxID=564369 RepID=UPI0020330399|nr:AraC family transcriptional regulator [Luteibacter anthropi]URX63182.1 AraC family transcriptional regulator [Luteibacter anthropi]
MTDPLAEVVALLQPRAGITKRVCGAGRWRVRRTEVGQPFYAVILEGTSWLFREGKEPTVLREGDFVLIPAAQDFTMTSFDPPTAEEAEVPPLVLAPGEIWLGTPGVPPDVRSLIGHCSFESADASLLVSLMPEVVLVRDGGRLAALVGLVRDEFRAERPARDVVLTRLLEVLLIEVLRSTMDVTASPGLLRGLADVRLAAAIRRMHERPTQAWTVAQLAKEAALSRSTFFERFNRAVGMAPMEYLLAWRMALAKHMLGGKEASVSEVAQRVGYGSASTFSVAFTRYVGVAPSRYAVEG